MTSELPKNINYPPPPLPTDHWSYNPRAYLTSYVDFTEPLELYLMTLHIWGYRYPIVEIRARFNPKIAMTLKEVDDNDICHTEVEGNLKNDYVKCQFGFESRHLLLYRPYFKPVHGEEIWHQLYKSFEHELVLKYEGTQVRKPKARGAAPKSKQDWGGINYDDPLDMLED